METIVCYIISFSVHPDTMKQTTLTPLEQEIRDELRLVADSIDGRVTHLSAHVFSSCPILGFADYF